MNEENSNEYLQLIAKAFNINAAKWRIAIVFISLAGMTYQAQKNIQEQMQMRGEYSNVEQESLFEWIVRETPEDAVFAGSMPVMANVKLSTRRPIVNHPHYENEEQRLPAMEKRVHN